MVRNSPVEPGAAYDDGKDSERRAQRQMKTKFSQVDSAEPHPVFFKDSERRAQRQMKTKFSQVDSAEPHPVFFKDSERRAQRQMKTKFSQVDSAEPHPVFSKDSERRAQRQMKTEFSQVDSAEPHPVFSKDTKRRGQRLPCPRRWGSRRAHSPAPASGRSEPSPSSGEDAGSETTACRSKIRRRTARKNRSFLETEKCCGFRKENFQFSGQNYCKLKFFSIFVIRITIANPSKFNLRHLILLAPWQEILKSETSRCATDSSPRSRRE